MPPISRLAGALHAGPAWEVTPIRSRSPRGEARCAIIEEHARPAPQIKPGNVGVVDPPVPPARGSSPASYPAKPLVSFRTNRLLSGWNPPPQAFRALGAHCQFLTHVLR